MKISVVKKPFYEMFIEHHLGLLWFHTDIHRWDKTTRKAYLEDFKELKKEFPVMYAIPYECDHKMIKFGALLGFTIIERHKCLDGVERNVFMLNQENE